VRLAIIIPVLDEAATIGPALERLADLRECGARVIVVDGGSRDDTLGCATATHGADQVLVAPRGRALQMNAGAQSALGCGADALLFLHADTQLPSRADRLIAEALTEHDWGRFDIAIQAQAPGNRLPLRIVSFMMNLRSRLTGIATGDQGIFMRRSLFDELGGFAQIPLMEDIEFSRRARRAAAPACLRARALTSGRRWERDGVWRTIALMWRLRATYFFGADPERLADQYRSTR
jgi:rSAM/selenodomain-associated transferase 2